MTPRTYSDCYFCGGEVKEQRVNRDVWWKGKLYLVQEVPTGVCGQCGHKFFTPDVLKALDSILAQGGPPDSVVEVPSYRFGEALRTG